MDRWRWLQHERAERPPNHRLPNAASSGRDESAQRASSFLANENNGKDQCWSATVHLNRFGLVAAAAGSNESRSTRLAQALFWGEYKDAFDAERSGMLEDGLVKVHLR